MQKRVLETESVGEKKEDLCNGPRDEKRLKCSFEAEGEVEGAGLASNPHLHGLQDDFLYHIGFKKEEIRDLFHDVKVGHRHVIQYLDPLYCMYYTYNVVGISYAIGQTFQLSRFQVSSHGLTV